MLGYRLKALRTKKKLTQKQLAEKINVTHVSISGYENGNRSPDTDTLEKIADYFGVSTDYLLGRTDTLEPTPLDSEEAEFQAFINDPELEMWYKELPKSDEDELRQLREVWKIINKKK